MFWRRRALVRGKRWPEAAVSLRRRAVALLGATAAVAAGYAGGPSVVTATTNSRLDTLDSYCSPTDDYCVAVLKRHGRIKFWISSEGFTGEYELCVRPFSRASDSGGQQRSTRCQTFELDRRRDGVYDDRVDWERHFPNRGAGHYKVFWRRLDERLDKALHFSVSAIG